MRFRLLVVVVVVVVVVAVAVAVAMVVAMAVAITFPIPVRRHGCRPRCRKRVLRLLPARVSPGTRRAAARTVAVGLKAWRAGWLRGQVLYLLLLLLLLLLLPLLLLLLFCFASYCCVFPPPAAAPAASVASAEVAAAVSKGGARPSGLLVVPAAMARGKERPTITGREPRLPFSACRFMADFV